MERLIEDLNINFSIEKDLWKQVFSSPEARGLLRNPNKSPLITVLGTDSNLSLSREILKTNPKSFISVVDNVLCVDLTDTLKPQDIIIAKHLIHQVDSVAFVTHIASALKDSGLFFASAPLFADKITSSKLNQGKCQLLHSGITLLREEPLRAFGGTVFVFAKGVSSSVESVRLLERMKRNFSAIPDRVLGQIWDHWE
jgi:hypothetical protein